MDPSRSANATVPEPRFVRNTRTEDLLGTELFHDAFELTIAGIRRSSRICTLKANRRLYTSRKNKRTGEPANFIYVLLDGYVAIWVPSCFDSKQEVFVAFRGPTQVLGELKQEDAKPSTTRIITCDECTFIEIKLSSFLELASRDSSLYRNIAHLLAQKIFNDGHRVEVLQIGSVPRKVAQTLIYLAQERCPDFSDAKTRFEIPGVIPQRQIGAYAGITRETANKAMQKLKARKLIDYSGGRRSRIKILNLPELRMIVENKSQDSARSCLKRFSVNDFS